MADKSETIGLAELLDLAIGSPEQGAVNFNLLKSVLQIIISQLLSTNEHISIEFRGNSADVIRNLKENSSTTPTQSLDMKVTRAEPSINKTNKESNEETRSDLQTIPKIDEELKTIQNEIESLKLGQDNIEHRFNLMSSQMNKLLQLDPNQDHVQVTPLTVEDKFRDLLWRPHESGYRTEPSQSDKIGARVWLYDKNDEVLQRVIEPSSEQMAMRKMDKEKRKELISAKLADMNLSSLYGQNRHCEKHDDPAYLNSDMFDDKGSLKPMYDATCFHNAYKETLKTYSSTTNSATTNRTVSITTEGVNYGSYFTKEFGIEIENPSLQTVPANHSTKSPRNNKGESSARNNGYTAGKDESQDKTLHDTKRTMYKAMPNDVQKYLFDESSSRNNDNKSGTTVEEIQSENSVKEVGYYKPMNTLSVDGENAVIGITLETGVYDDACPQSKTSLKDNPMSTNEILTKELNPSEQECAVQQTNDEREHTELRNEVNQTIHPKTKICTSKNCNADPSKHSSQHQHLEQPIPSISSETQTVNLGKNVKTNHSQQHRIVKPCKVILGPRKHESKQRPNGKYVQNKDEAKDIIENSSNDLHEVKEFSKGRSKVSSKQFNDNSKKLLQDTEKEIDEPVDSVHRKKLSFVTADQDSHISSFQAHAKDKIFVEIQKCVTSKDPDTNTEDTTKHVSIPNVNQTPSELIHKEGNPGSSRNLENLKNRENASRNKHDKATAEYSASILELEENIKRQRDMIDNMTDKSLNQRSALTKETSDTGNYMVKITNNNVHSESTLDITAANNVNQEINKYKDSDINAEVDHQKRFFKNHYTRFNPDTNEKYFKQHNQLPINRSLTDGNFVNENNQETKKVKITNNEIGLSYQNEQKPKINDNRDITWGKQDNHQLVERHRFENIDLIQNVDQKQERSLDIGRRSKQNDTENQMLHRQYYNQETSLNQQMVDFRRNLLPQLEEQDGQLDENRFEKRLEHYTMWTKNADNKLISKVDIQEGSDMRKCLEGPPDHCGQRAGDLGIIDALWQTKEDEITEEMDNLDHKFNHEKSKAISQSHNKQRPFDMWQNENNTEEIGERAHMRKDSDRPLGHNEHIARNSKITVPIMKKQDIQITLEEYDQHHHNSNLKFNMENHSGIQQHRRSNNTFEQRFKQNEYQDKWQTQNHYQEIGQIDETGQKTNLRKHLDRPPGRCGQRPKCHGIIDAILQTKGEDQLMEQIDNFEHTSNKVNQSVSRWEQIEEVNERTGHLKWKERNGQENRQNEEIKQKLNVRNQLERPPGRKPNQNEHRNLEGNAEYNFQDTKDNGQTDHGRNMRKPIERPPGRCGKRPKANETRNLTWEDQTQHTRNNDQQISHLTNNKHQLERSPPRHGQRPRQAQTKAEQNKVVIKTFHKLLTDDDYEKQDRMKTFGKNSKTLNVLHFNTDFDTAASSSAEVSSDLLLNVENGTLENPSGHHNQKKYGDHVHMDLVRIMSDLQNRLTAKGGDSFEKLTYDALDMIQRILVDNLITKEENSMMSSGLQFQHMPLGGDTEAWTRLQDRLDNSEREIRLLKDRVSHLQQSEKKRTNEMLTREAYDIIRQLQADVETIHGKLAHHAETIDDNKLCSESLYDFIREMDYRKMDNKDLDNIKSDIVNKLKDKVDVEGFKEECTELVKAIDIANKKVDIHRKFQILQSDIVNKILEMLPDKIQKTEFQEITDMKITEALKKLEAKLKKIADRTEEGASGSNKPMIRNLQCISCNTGVVMRDKTDTFFLSPPLRPCDTSIHHPVPPNNIKLINRYCGGSNTRLTAAQKVRIATARHPPNMIELMRMHDRAAHAQDEQDLADQEAFPDIVIRR